MNIAHPIHAWFNAVAKRQKPPFYQNSRSVNDRYLNNGGTMAAQWRGIIGKIQVEVKWF